MRQRLLKIGKESREIGQRFDAEDQFRDMDAMPLGGSDTLRPCIQGTMSGVLRLDARVWDLRALRFVCLLMPSGGFDAD